MNDIQPVHRRVAARHAIVLECDAVRESGFQTITRQLLDLSPEGAFIATEARDVELGEEVWLTFRVPKGDVWMHARAKVVRYGRESFRGDCVRGLGVQFIELDRVDHDHLVRSLAGLPPPIPTTTRPMDYASFVRDVDEGVA